MGSSLPLNRAASSLRVLPSLRSYPYSTQKRPLSLSRLCAILAKAQPASLLNLSASIVATGLDDPSPYSPKQSSAQEIFWCIDVRAYADAPSPPHSPLSGGTGTITTRGEFGRSVWPPAAVPSTDALGLPQCLAASLHPPASVAHQPLMCLLHRNSLCKVCGRCPR